MSDKKVGVAFGSGGSLGFAHIGVIKVFEEHNLPIDVISGASIGSIIGAHYSLFKDRTKLEKDCYDFLKKFSFKLFSVTTVLESKKLINEIYIFLDSVFGNKKFSDCKIPFSVMAVDLEKGEPVEIKTGYIKDGILASMSVPMVFPPHFHWGAWLVDGGLLDPVPLKVLEASGCNVLIGVNLFPKVEKTYSKKPSSLQVFARLLYIIQQAIGDYNVKLFSDKIIIYPDYEYIEDNFSQKNMLSYVKAGERGAKKELHNILEKLK